MQGKEEKLMEMAEEKEMLVQRITVLKDELARARNKIAIATQEIERKDDVYNEQLDHMTRSANSFVRSNDLVSHYKKGVDKPPRGRSITPATTRSTAFHTTDSSFEGMQHPKNMFSSLPTSPHFKENRPGVMRSTSPVPQRGMSFDKKVSSRGGDQGQEQFHDCVQAEEGGAK